MIAFIQDESILLLTVNACVLAEQNVTLFFDFSADWLLFFLFISIATNQKYKNHWIVYLVAIFLFKVLMNSEIDSFGGIEQIT